MNNTKPTKRNLSLYIIGFGAPLLCKRGIEEQYKHLKDARKFLSQKDEIVEMALGSDIMTN